MKEIKTYDEQGSYSIRRILMWFEYEPYEFIYQNEVRTSTRCTFSEEVLVGLSNREVRMRYPKRTGRVRYPESPTSDFLSMTALFITGLIPVGVWADALEESYPGQNDIANFIRKWDTQEKQQ